MSERVLIVEDDPLVAAAAQAALEQLPDLEIDCVEDGRRALIRLTTDRWHLVVTDVELPGADGLQILRAAKDADPHVPVIVMTAHEKLDYAIAAVRGDADEYLVKPIDPQELAATAKRLLGAARVRREQQDAARRSVLAIGAHPDDVELGCGGALLEHLARGDRVTLLVLTGGAADGDAPPRAREAQDAASVLGAELVHAALPEAALPEGEPTAAAIAEQVERLAPEVVYTHSLVDDHQDHRNAHRATLAAARDVPNLFAYQAPSTGIAFAPSRFVDVTPYMDAKLRALREFRSEHAARPYLDQELVVATARYWSRFAPGRYVEPFEVVRTMAAPLSSAAGAAARQAGR